MHVASLNHYNCWRARINRMHKESMTHFKWMLSVQGQDRMICKVHISECFPTDGIRNNSYPKIILGFLSDSIDCQRCAQTLKDVNEQSLLSIFKCSAGRLWPPGHTTWQVSAKKNMTLTWDLRETQRAAAADEWRERRTLETTWKIFLSLCYKPMRRIRDPSGELHH